MIASMRKIEFQIFLVLALLVGSPVFGSTCDIGSVKAESQNAKILFRIASADCNAAKEKTLSPLNTNDSVALKITVETLNQKTGTKPPELTAIVLARDDQFASHGVPTIRLLKDNIYFADNLQFSAPGTWLISVVLKNQSGETKVTLPVDVILDPKKLSEIRASEKKIPDFSLTDIQGKTVTQSNLTGKIWLANYFFTTCPEICPLMMSKIALIQDKFKEYPDFKVVSISTDPKSDTAAAIESFAKRHQADFSKWIFLTGEKSAVTALSANGLLLDASLDSVMHSTRIALIDRNGVVRGRYDSTKVEETEQLIRDIKAMLKSSS